MATLLKKKKKVDLETKICSKMMKILTWTRNMFEFTFHYYLLVLQLAISCHKTPKEHPVKSTSVVHDDNRVLTLWRLVPSDYNLDSKHHLCALREENNYQWFNSNLFFF